MKKHNSPMMGYASRISLAAMSLLALTFLLWDTDDAEAAEITQHEYSAEDSIRTVAYLLAEGAKLCASDHPTIVTVAPGQSIQSAINDATPGTMIKVLPGRYAGCLDLGGIHGTDNRPILLVSETPAAAVLVGDSTCAVIDAGIADGGASYVGVYGFTIVSNTLSGDIGGIKIAGPWIDPAHNIAIVGNIITGRGQDAVKFFNGARDFIVAGNIITGSWRQEAIDNVSVERAVYAFNSTGGAHARYTSITLKGASRDIEIYGNYFDVKPSDPTFRPTQVSIGGFGDYRRLKQPPHWVQPFQAKGVNVHDNVIGGPNSIVFAAGVNSVVRNNRLGGGISYSCGRDVRFSPDQVLCGTAENNTVDVNTPAGRLFGAAAPPINEGVCPGGVMP